MEKKKFHETTPLSGLVCFILAGTTLIVVTVYIGLEFAPESNLGLHALFSLAICMILSHFYKSSHSKGVKICDFIFQFVLTFVLVSWVRFITVPLFL
jgi:hypothetical protein